MQVLFTTPRLKVRAWTEADRPLLHSLLSDPVTMAHWPAPLDDAGVDVWLDWALDDMARVGYARWCVELADSGRMIGDVGIRNKEMFGALENDLGYIIHHNFWRQGYAYEAASGAVAWARSRGLVDVVANMATNNLGSVAVAEKLGMQREREFINPNNRDKPTYWYRLKLAESAQPSPLR